jgi:DNA topoisomerase I
MKLMIVESPNKTKKIQSALGAGWEVVASVGHIRAIYRRKRWPSIF